MIKIIFSILFFLLCLPSLYAEKSIYTFDASWCSHCHVISKQLDSDKESQEIIKKYRGFLKLDVDKFPKLTKKWGISTIPQYLIVEVSESEDGIKAVVLDRWIPSNSDPLPSLKEFLKKGLTASQK